MSRALPTSASIAEAGSGGKLHAPSAARNVAALTQMLQGAAPLQGKGLELASGTGQHIVAYAQAMPAIHWQPTEVDATRRASIDAYVAEAALPNVAPAAAINATAPGWSDNHRGQDLILLSNLLHLISASETQTLITEAARALNAEGTLILYGPFARDGVLTSDGDKRFDADLRGADPEIGYKDTADMARWLQGAGLSAPIQHAMPANNLTLISRKGTA